jgi:lysophospholipase L1-like esterase
VVGRGGSLGGLLAVALLAGLISCGGRGASPAPPDGAVASTLDLGQADTSAATASSRVAPIAASTPTPSPGLAWGPTETPPAACRLFLLAGQSNMAGHGRYDELPPGDDGALPPNVTIAAVSLDVHLRPLEGGFGPELTLARNLAAAHPGETLLLIKYAVEGSSLLDWAPDWDAKAAAQTGHPEYGPLYRRLLELVAAKREDPQHTACQPAAVFWMQGERDALFLQAAAAYEANLAALIEALRTDLGAPVLPFLVGQVDPPGDRYPAAELVRAAQAAVARKLPGVYLVRTDGLSRRADGLHYDTAGQLELGRGFASAYLNSP